MKIKKKKLLPSFLVRRFYTLKRLKVTKVLSRVIANFIKVKKKLSFYGDQFGVPSPLDMETETNYTVIVKITTSVCHLFPVFRQNIQVFFMRAYVHHYDQAIPSPNIDLHYAYYSRNLQSGNVCGNIVPKTICRGANHTH